MTEESEGLQLSNQEYSICVRHERGFCGISYTACEDTDSFSISAPAGLPLVGDTACTKDWISIPCATTSTAGSSKQAAGGQPENCIERICGSVFCSVTNNPTNRTDPAHCSIYSFVRPFTIRVHLDSDEVGDGSPATNRGFCFRYVQQPCIS